MKDEISREGFILHLLIQFQINVLVVPPLLIGVRFVVTSGSMASTRTTVTVHLKVRAFDATSLYKLVATTQRVSLE